MNIFDIIFGANSNLSRNKTRTFLNILAIFVASLTLCLSVGISSGLKSYLNTLLDTIDAPSVLIISKKASDGSSPLSSILGDIQEYQENSEKNQFGQLQINLDTFEKDISKIENIKHVEPSLRLQSSITYVQLGEGKKYSILSQVLSDGLNVKLSLGENIKNPDEIIIPSKLADQYNLKPEDILGKTMKVAYTTQDRSIVTKEMKIVGISTPTLFTSNIYIGYDFAKEIADSKIGNIDKTKTTYSQMIASLNKFDKDSIAKTKSDLDKIGYSAVTFEDQTQTINSFLDSIQYGLLAFAAISLIAASFGIINTMIISVLERTKEIGLSKALGMNSFSVFLTFLIESILLGFWGAVSGVIGAILIGNALNNYSASTILKDFPGFNLFVFLPKELALIIGIICLVCLLAGSIPSIRASKLNPINALRYE